MSNWCSVAFSNIVATINAFKSVLCDARYEKVMKPWLMVALGHAPVADADCPNVPNMISQSCDGRSNCSLRRRGKCVGAESANVSNWAMCCDCSVDQKMFQYADEVLDSICDVVNALMPVVCDDVGLVPASVRPSISRAELVSSRLVVGALMRTAASTWDGSLSTLASHAWRKNVIARLLLSGVHNTTDERLLSAAMPYMSHNLRIRSVLQGRLVFQWLRGRRDLLPVVDLLVDATFLGHGCFAQVVGTATEVGACPILVDLSTYAWFDGCHHCVRQSLKPIKLALRACTGQPASPTIYADSASWQYVDMMLGRYDNDVFDDLDDMRVRLDYDELRVPRPLGIYADEIEAGVLALTFNEGMRFGALIASNPSYQKYGLRGVHDTAFCDVPTGSVEREYCVPDSDEVDSQLMNKKLAFAYMDDEAFAALLSWSNLSSWCRVIRKTEVAKQRNLAAGSLPLYALSTMLSRHAEDAYLASLPEVPLMHSITLQQRMVGRVWDANKHGYVACRDYTNFNIVHKHSEIRMFYLGVAEHFRQLGNGADVILVVDKILRCLDEVGIVSNGQHYRWLHGLMTGWRHTMLLNTLFNVVLGRLARSWLRRVFGIDSYIALHQGDDSVEVYDHPLGGPLVQSLLDTAGKEGGAQKQKFSARHGGWFEFLRVNYYGDTQCASVVRGLGGSLSSDLQHPPKRSGPQMLRGLVESVNTWFRRNGYKSTRRLEDVQNLLTYWGTTTTQHELGVITPWAVALLPEQSGGLGCILAKWPWLTATGSVKLERRWRVSPPPAPNLASTLRGKMCKISALDLEPYSVEYATDFLAAAAEEEVDVVVYYPVQVVQLKNPIGADMATIDFICNQVMCGVRGEHLPSLPADQLAAELAVGALFGGSYLVARAYLRDHETFMPMVSAFARTTMLQRGVEVLRRCGAAVERYDATPQALPGEWMVHIQSCWRMLQGNLELAQAVARRLVSHKSVHLFRI